MAKDQFWTDAGQASERLTNCYILYNDLPVYVERVREGGDGVAVASVYDHEAKKLQLSLNDPGFHRFRKLPPLGWINTKRPHCAAYLARRPRRTRQHGLSEDNLTVDVIHNSTGALQRAGYEISTYIKDPGYLLCCKKEYPTLDDILNCVKEDTALAVSPLYAVFRDNLGLRWLYRGTERIGLFSGADTLTLINTFAYLKEELTDASEITVKNIQEF